MTALPVFYSFRRCPFAMRARMAMKVSGAEAKHREILLKDKPAEMLTASPKGTVPVLVLDDGKVIDESLDIMHWVLGQNDPEGWLAPEPEEQAALIWENDHRFKHHLDRYKYATRYEGEDPDYHRAKAMAFLTKLEDRLSGEYLFGNRRRLADVAIFPFVRQFRTADPDWFDAAPFAGVQDWLRRLSESELFVSIMDKRPLWQGAA